MQQKLFLEPTKGKEALSPRQIPREVKKEVLILHKLGLEPYEIEYLIHLRLKEKLRFKWK